MPIAISAPMTRPAARTTRAVLSGLAVATPPTTPTWVRSHLAADTLVAVSLKLPSLLGALAVFRPDVEDDRSGVVDWVSHDDSTIAVDLLVPLLVLARDIQGLGEDNPNAELVLDGA